MSNSTISLFKKEVKNLDDYLVLITVSSKNYQKTNIDVIKFLINDEKTPGVYVTLNKPYNIIERSLKNNNVDARLIIFIDGVTQTGNKNKKIKNCLFIGSPEKLSDISMAMDQAVKALPKEKFVFFDSINTLTIFNSPATVARFVHYLAGKMREWKIKGIIISLEKDVEESLLNELTQLSDSRIDIKS
ncbi:hypothetical protein ISS05_05625 [Candidatus Woesearchaeota archaeon]|nr:hypothetical protein [Candidatus Woesearchaeota archaeon]